MTERPKMLDEYVQVAAELGRVEQTPSLYEACQAAGFRLESHESDLYVEASAASLELLTERGAKFSPFTDTEGQCWYDVPFAYDPFWTRKGETR